MTQSYPRDSALLVLSLLLLAGAGLDRLSMRPSKSAVDYHGRVLAAYKAMPLDMGVWSGAVVPEPADAIDMLKPNVMLSRSYRDKSTDRQATFLLVQCSDVRDLISHYPPICYPNQGRELAHSPSTFDWDIDQVTIHGTQYTFESKTLRDSGLTVVYNFMVLPDKSILPNMEVAKKYLSLDRRYFGMAQVQIVFDGRTPVKIREEIARDLIHVHMSLIEVIRTGANS